MPYSRTRLRPIALLVLLALPSLARAEDSPFTLASPDGAYQLVFGGYLQADSRWFIEDHGKLNDQFLIRRARLELAGTALHVIDYRLQADFASSRLALQNAWIDVRFLPELRLRAGKMVIPFGLERLQPDRHTTFAERSLATDLLPNRDIGLELHGDAGPVAWAAGVFDGAADGVTAEGDTSDDKELVARLWVRPLASLGPAWQRVGVGAAVTWGDAGGTLAAPDVPSYVTPAQVTFFAPVAGATADTTVIARDRRLRATAQSSAYVGPVGVLAELVYSGTEVQKGADAGSIDALAWNLTAAWVVTGEDATENGPDPARPFGAPGGIGAWELDARYHELHVSDGTFDSGFADDAVSARAARAFGLGVRWHASHTLRVLVDFEHTSFRGGAPAGGDRADEDVISTRVQAQF